MADPAIAERSWPMASAGRRSATRPREHSRLAAVLTPASALTLVLLSWVLVALTAAHPNFMAPTTTTGYFPGWMSGPLGGLLGRTPPSEDAMRTLVTVILVAMYLAYAAIGTLASRPQARWVIGAVLATHLAFLLAPPLQYTGRLQLHQLRAHGGPAPPEPLHDDPDARAPARPCLLAEQLALARSPYGPLFTLFTYALVPLAWRGASGPSRSSCACRAWPFSWLVWRCAVILGRDPVRAVALAGLNPIVLLWGLGADHNDLLMMLPLVLGVYLLLRARAGEGAERVRLLGSSIACELLAAGAFVAAAGIKASAVVVIPVALAAAPRKRNFLAGLAASGLVLLAISFAAFGAHLPGVGSQTELVTGVGPANLLGGALGSRARRKPCGPC